jgi:hypothetical protein
VEERSTGIHGGWGAFSSSNQGGLGILGSGGEIVLLGLEPLEFSKKIL